MSGHMSFNNLLKAGSVEMVLDFMGNEVRRGDKIVYIRGSHTNKSKLVLGTVLDIERKERYYGSLFLRMKIQAVDGYRPSFIENVHNIVKIDNVES